MIFPLLLTLLVLPAAAQAQEALPVQPPTTAEAEELANAGNDESALEAFRQIAARNPDDHHARMWIARLHDRMGNPELAAPVYESVLLEDSGNLDARLGLATMLLELDDPERALEALEPVEPAQAQNSAVLTALARAHHLEGRNQVSIDYYERAAAAEPSQARVLALEAARVGHAHRLEVRGFSEQYDGSTPDGRSAEVLLDYRVNEQWRVIGRGQAQRKLGLSEQRYGGGAAWQWKPGLTLRGHALVGPDNVVMPEGDYLGELTYTYHAATWIFDVRHFDFTGARTFVVSPALNWQASDRWLLGVRYAASSSVSNALADAEGGHSLHLRGEYTFRPRLTASLGYAAGVEDFENFSIDRIGDFRANSLSGGVRLDLPTLTSIRAGYEHQWRSGDTSMGRVTLALQQSF